MGQTKTMIKSLRTYSLLLMFFGLFVMLTQFSLFGNAGANNQPNIQLVSTAIFLMTVAFIPLLVVISNLEGRISKLEIKAAAKDDTEPSGD